MHFCVFNCFFDSHSFERWIYATVWRCCLINDTLGDTNPVCKIYLLIVYIDCTTNWLEKFYSAEWFLIMFQEEINII